MRSLLPTEIDKLNEETQMALVYAIEERNCMQVELDLAARCCRQHIFAAHHQALVAARINTTLNSVADGVHASIHSAVDQQMAMSQHRASTQLSFPSAPNAGSKGKYILPKLVATTNGVLLGCSDRGPQVPSAGNSRAPSITHCRR